MTHPERNGNGIADACRDPSRSQDGQVPRDPSRPDWLAISFGLLCLIGAGFSADLVVVHYRSHTDPLYKPQCAVTDALNCETVALSPYSVWLGVPVAVWGLVGFLACAPIAFCGGIRRRPNPTWPFGLLICFASVAVAVSGYLAYLSYFRIKSFCLYCSATYVVNLALLALSSGALASLRTGPVTAVIRDVKSWARRPRSLAGFAVPVLVCVCALVLAWPPYWKRAEAGESRAMAAGASDNGEHWIGADQPRLVIVEYTDYECPFCRRAHRTVRDFVARHASTVRLVHKHFPLDQRCNPLVNRPFHGRACELSRFVSCAGDQGRFWEANDAVLSALDTVRADDIDTGRIQADLKLDAGRLQSCLRQEASEVARDIQDGIALDVSATPTYFIGGARYEGAVPASVLEDAWRRASGASPVPALIAPPASEGSGP